MLTTTNSMFIDYEAKHNDIENEVVLISWSKQDLSNKIYFSLSTDIWLFTIFLFSIQV